MQTVFKSSGLNSKINKIPPFTVIHSELKGKRHYGHRSEVKKELNECQDKFNKFKEEYQNGFCAGYSLDAYQKKNIYKPFKHIEKHFPRIATFQLLQEVTVQKKISNSPKEETLKKAIQDLLNNPQKKKGLSQHLIQYLNKLDPLLDNLFLLEKVKKIKIEILLKKVTDELAGSIVNCKTAYLAPLIQAINELKVDYNLPNPLISVKKSLFKQALFPVPLFEGSELKKWNLSEYLIGHIQVPKNALPEDVVLSAVNELEKNPPSGYPGKVIVVLKNGKDGDQHAIVIGHLNNTYVVSAPGLLPMYLPDPDQFKEGMINVLKDFGDVTHFSFYYYQKIDPNLKRVRLK